MIKAILKGKKRLLRKLKENRGYTLVEMLTVIVIVITISTIVFANYHSGNRQLELDMEAYKISSDIRRVQEMGLSYPPVPGYHDADMGGYGVFFSTGADYYTIFADTFPAGGNGQYDTGDKTLEIVNMRSNFKITSVNSGHTSVIFIPPDPKTLIKDVVGEITQFTIKIAREDNQSYEKKIIVNQAGLIYVD